MNSHNKLIHVWSDVVTINSCHTWYDVIWNETNWRYGGRSGHAEEPFRHWSSTVRSDIFTQNVQDPLCHVELICFEIWNCMKKYFDEVLPNLIPIRVILNSFNFGDNVWIHKDSDAEGFYTCIMYLNPYWDINWGGDTVFVNDKKDSIIEAIYPKPGRFVLFDSRIQHGPRSLSREAHLPRVGITFLCKVG